MKIREKYIKRCIELAKNGLGKTYPNPMVGSVIVYDDKIIGEGWHQFAGGPHAEVNAVNSVKDKALLKKATIYVSLEPCSHFGKTPPCSDLIIENEIPNVVIGTIDPFAEVAGRGVEKLRAQGCSVEVGVLEKECQELNKRFFTFHNRNRPYIILKWAETLDGFIDVDRNVYSLGEAKPNWITGKYARQLVHKWRTEEQAILVGTNTVVNDNPKLNARDWKGKDPVRVVLDKRGRISKDYHVFDGNVKTIVLREDHIEIKAPSENTGVIIEQIDYTKGFPQQMCAVMEKHHIQSIIVEGGKQTLQSFINSGLWDEARIFTGDTHFYSGVKAPVVSGAKISEQTIVNDVLTILKNIDR